jgi:LCP family protein required for cell wall assembly
VNVLIVGSDAGRGRAGTRPDTVVLASVDTRTGATTLVSLPRNLSGVPFPPGTRQAAEYPEGFVCRNAGAGGTNTDCLLNSLWSFAEEHRDEYYPGDRRPGLTATRQGVEQVTGLAVHDSVVVTMAGLQHLVDAVGGVRVSVRQRLPIGGSSENPGALQGWIEKGEQRLDGWHALWYARSRWSTSDYDRMRRQRCLLGALVTQLDWARAARSFPNIAAALRENLSTSIRIEDLPAWVELAGKVQERGELRSLVLDDRLIDPNEPDLPEIRRLVRAAFEQESRSGAASGAASGGDGGAEDVLEVC